MNDVLESRGEALTQFSLFTQNKLGKLHDVIRLLNAHQVHVMALTILDATDSAIIRLVVDDPDRARILLIEHDLFYNESKVIGLEIRSEKDLNRALNALLQAEINIHYTYPFLSRPHDASALVLSLEDPDVAAQCLRQCGFRVLNQEDVSR